MEDFESLLRGAAANYENEKLSEAAVSEMIDKRLVTSKSKLQASVRKETWMIVFCVGVFILYIAIGRDTFHKIRPAMVGVYTMGCCAGILYCLINIILFVRLLQLSLLEKDKGIRSYITVVYKKTKQTVQVYFWTSVVTNIGLVGTLLFFSKVIPLSLVILITVVFGILIYYLNIWYINLRFGRKLQELKQLIAEFNEPDN
jgi:small-conductance mechanosensitive channel